MGYHANRSNPGGSAGRPAPVRLVRSRDPSQLNAPGDARILRFIHAPRRAMLFGCARTDSRAGVHSAPVFKPPPLAGVRSSQQAVIEINVGLPPRARPGAASTGHEARWSGGRGRPGFMLRSRWRLGSVVAPLRRRWGTCLNDLADPACLCRCSGVVHAGVRPKPTGLAWSAGAAAASSQPDKHQRAGRFATAATGGPIQPSIPPASNHAGAAEVGIWSSLRYLPVPEQCGRRLRQVDVLVQLADHQSAASAFSSPPTASVSAGAWCRQQWQRASATSNAAAACAVVVYVISASYTGAAARAGREGRPPVRSAGP